jgi:hypothetical protein
LEVRFVEDCKFGFGLLFVFVLFDFGEDFTLEGVLGFVVRTLLPVFWLFVFVYVFPEERVVGFVVLLFVFTDGVLFLSLITALLGCFRS